MRVEEMERCMSVLEQMDTNDFSTHFNNVNNNFTAAWNEVQKFMIAINDCEQ